MPAWDSLLAWPWQFSGEKPSLRLGEDATLMSMSRHFKTVNYQEALQTTIRLDDCLPQDHLAQFLADVVEELNLAEFYARYEKRGAAPYAPEILLALLV
jgi:transposase